MHIHRDTNLVDKITIFFIGRILSFGITLSLREEYVSKKKMSKIEFKRERKFFYCPVIARWTFSFIYIFKYRLFLFLKKNVCFIYK